MREYAYDSPRRQKSSGRYRQSSSNTEWVHILLFYILPFIIVNGLIFFLVTAKPSFQLTIGETHDYLSTEIQLKVKSILPTKELSVALNSEPVELTKGKGGVYTAALTKNGTLELSVKSLNGMAAFQYENISILDDNPPAVDKYSIEDGILTFTLEDSQSGIDYNSIYAIDASGVSIFPKTADKNTGTVTFEMESDTLTVFTSDLSGNESQTTFNRTSGETSETASAN